MGTDKAGSLSHHNFEFFAPGPIYDTVIDTVIDTVPPGTEQIETNAGLMNPGDTASFRVYVVLTTGNASGSNTVVIDRV